MLALLFLAGCSGENGDDSNFRINGNIAGGYEGKAYLLKRESGEWIRLDSAETIQGNFMLKGFLELPEAYYIGDNSGKGYALLFVEPGEIIFKTEATAFRDSAVISGSASHQEYDAFMENSKKYEELMEEAYENMKTARNAGDEETAGKWEAEYDRINGELKQFVLDYATKNNRSVVSAYIVLRNAYYYDENDLEPVVNQFSSSISGSVYVKKLTERVETLKRVAVGQPAVDFTMNDTAGNPVALSALFGNYLLVDFWASWCGPCRQENPNIVEIYRNYHVRGFDVLGVSFDKSRDKWLQAIADDNLTWHHVSDLAYWNNAAGKLYAVNSIPSNVLLNPEGIIIAKNLRGEELQNKIEEILGQK
ncbi:MAG: AhpC/TSA family protein [Bacteroidales bacterium]|nr:AhpC/TSA family protein [Bacteroidales bacterium]